MMCGTRLEELDLATSKQRFIMDQCDELRLNDIKVGKGERSGTWP